MIGWALRASEQLEGDWRLRTKFVISALSQRSAAETFRQAPPESPIGTLLCEWPDTVGYLLWPYQCSAWDAAKRISRIQGHLDVLQALPGLKLGPEDKLVLADLGWVSPDVFLAIDRAKWLSREGHLTLSLFKGDFRAFTASFSLYNGGELELFIGGIQGRNGDDILSLYRDLTKDFHGMRPRDFMLEALRLFARAIGVKHIYAVADDSKISRHKYFGEKGAPGLFYDDIWVERGGTKVNGAYFELPLDGTRREIEDIPAKKRSMYRRRYEMLDEIEKAIPEDLTRAERRHFDAR